MKKMLRKEGIEFEEVSVDTKSGEKLADKHNVSEIPTMIIDGKLVNDVRKWTM